MALAAACTTGGAPAVAATLSEEASWSIDDVKDVCEGTQFVAITVGIAVAVWWYLSVYLPRVRAPQVEVNLEVAQLGSHEGLTLVELAATVCNRGRRVARLEPIRFEVSQAELSGLASAASTLARLPERKALIEGGLLQEVAPVQPFTQHRYACPIAVPPGTECVVVTVRWRLLDQPQDSEATRVVRLA